MTDQQKLFVDHYLRLNCNATKAAEAAGYGSPAQRGSELRKDPAVAAEIERRLADHAMSANEVLARLTDHARGDLGEFLEIDGGGFTRLNLAKAKEAASLHLLKTWEYDRRSGMKIALHDPQAALVQLGRYHKLFTERHEHDFSKFSDEELIAEAKSIVGGGEAPGADESE